MDHKKLLHDTINYWKDNNIFQKSIDQRPEELSIITYDGPPFASGTPHYGHGLVSVMKDALARFKTMQGYRVERKWGWDCHGLPVEKFVEKELGIDGKRDIEEKIGVEKFVEACRATVNNVNDEWKIFVDMVGRWADMDNAYFTMDLDFMESVMWVFGKMYKQNLVYKGFAIQGYCPSCATALSNSEINDGYKDRQDPAITVTFRALGSEITAAKKESFATTSDGYIHYVQGVIRNDAGDILSLFNKKYNRRQLPGGKVDKGETPEQSLIREIQEELGVTAHIDKHIGDWKMIIAGDFCCISLFDVTITDEPQIQEKNKHAYLDYVSIVDYDNTLGRAYKAKNMIVSDVADIMQFFDLYALRTLTGLDESHKQGLARGSHHLLARTTTPWTLPSNMFLAVGRDITYVQIFDLVSQQYYILAEDLLSSYYKNTSDYIIIYRSLGADLLDIQYTPLFDFYAHDASVDQSYKSKVHRVLSGSFVSTDSGTGIVHIAPAFGQDDFEVVAEQFPREDAKNWLFMPINEYGEFTDTVPNRKGVRVYEANKDIIQNLKDRHLLVANKSYNHSYPHCWRCDTPLIYKAMDSWFIKEQHIAQDTIPAIDDIKFIPETVKNRFRDVLKSAPDWNISRNRYRGAPIPIWESDQDSSDRVVIDSLEQLFNYCKSGSANITKNIFIRHGHSEHNKGSLHNTYGDSSLTQKGEKQAGSLAKKLKKALGNNNDYVIVVSPLERTWQTIYPFLQECFDVKTMQTLEKKYQEYVALYRDLWSNNKITQYIRSDKEKNLFHIGENIYVDFRITDLLVPDLEGEVDAIHKEWNDQKLSAHGESIIDAYDRVHHYLCDVNTLFKTRTVITVSHEYPIVLMRRAHRQFNFDTQQQRYLPEHTGLYTHYWDNDRKMEVDLHKPYVDNYRFTLKDIVYHRIPEVLDCWFESGSMPYGQMHYMGSKGDAKLLYPADFIIEGLDQTRGWFRTLHVLGQGLMNKNAYNHVIINGLILAADGKKMSKKLKNYPDPQELFYKYGSDAFRMFVLSTPVVRAEPVRMGEGQIEQTYKDFTAPLMNAFNFFQTYAQIDNFVPSTTQAYFVGSHTNIVDLKANDVLRMDADIIIDCSKDTQAALSTKFTMIYQTLGSKKVAISHSCPNANIDHWYQDILKTYANKNIVIIADKEVLQTVRHTMYGKKNANPDYPIIPLPTYTIHNDLDRWILAELHATAGDIETAMNSYLLDAASKDVFVFIDKLTNRYIRRSRRRFWASGMDADKVSAYNTLYTVLTHLIKLIAPFAPFVAEHLWGSLQDILHIKKKDNSVHLAFMPLVCDQYVDTKLLEEIAVVRKIISLGLFVRAKNGIKIKQPLQSMDIAMQ